MKIYLASYFEPENHGSGRKISISPSKPENIKVDFKFEELSPSKESMEKYYKKRYVDIKKAGEEFVAEYKSKLDFVYEDLKNISKDSSKKIIDILPFKNNDTLLSWEKKGNTSYRAILAEYLTKFGYEIDLQ